jgi:hypothetical protein
MAPSSNFLTGLRTTSGSPFRTCTLNRLKSSEHTARYPTVTGARLPVSISPVINPTPDVVSDFAGCRSVMAGRAAPRLQLLSQHIEPSSPFPVIPPSHSQQIRNFSIARRLSQEKETPVKMSNQEPHATLLIPGPIEFEDEVLKSMSHYR